MSQQNHIWRIDRRYRDARYSAVVVAPSKGEALRLAGMVNGAGFTVTNIGTASKAVRLGIVVADVHGEFDDEEYSLPC